jgi:hypothetical protein
MTKPRKPLNDALADQFVYGEKTSSSTSAEEVSNPVLTLQPESSIKESSLRTKLLEAEAKEATVRLTVDLTESMHRKLSLLSARTGRKKAVIVRMLLEEALEDVND